MNRRISLAAGVALCALSSLTAQTALASPASPASAPRAASVTMRATIAAHQTKLSSRTIVPQTLRVNTATATGNTTTVHATSPRTANRRTFQTTVGTSAAARRTQPTLSRANVPMATTAGANSKITLYDANFNAADIINGTAGDKWFVDHTGGSDWSEAHGPQHITYQGTFWQVSIGRFGPNGQMRYYRFPAGVTSVSNIISGARDSVWFVADHEVPVPLYAAPSADSTATLVNLMPSGRTTSFSLPFQDGEAIAPAPEGGLWISGMKHSGASELLMRTASGKVTAYNGGGLPVNQGPVCGMTTGTDGRVWMSTSTYGNSTKKHPQYDIYAMTTGGKVTAYTNPSTQLDTCSLVKGPDGNVWYVDQMGNDIGKITPAGKVTEYSGPAINVSLNGWGGRPYPADIIVRPGGDLWFFNDLPSATESVGKITTSGTVTDFPLPAKYFLDSTVPMGLTAGPDGDLWVTSAYGPITRMTPAGALTIYDQSSFGQALSIAGTSKSVWFSGWDGQIGLSTLTGKTKMFDLPNGLRAQVPDMFATASDGSLWFDYDAVDLGNPRGVNGVGHLTAAGVLKLYPVSGLLPFPNFPQLWGMNVNPVTGSVWFGSLATRQVFALSPAGKLTSYTSSAIQSAGSFTAGPKGDEWFTDGAADTIDLITPAGKVTTYWGDELTEPNFVHTFGSHVWVADSGDGTVAELDPASGAIKFRWLGNSQYSVPSGLAIQPDGTVWVSNEPAGGTTLSNYRDNVLTKITPDGKMTSLYRGNWDLGVPSNVTIAGHSTVWVANFYTGLVKITTGS